MKILAIRGCNLASIEGEFEVDFRTEPLRSAGIFAITGNTGAGKTTILDAMCIALYRNSPRLDNLGKTLKVEEDVTVGDIRTLLRKGKAYGYAETDFLAVDGCEYRVRCVFSRSRSKASGRMKDAEMYLTNLTTDTGRKLSASEHKTEIPLLVGLEYKQFTRAVLLAQGNFSAFLKANDNEKALMLETLTDTGIYSRISERIFTKTKEVKAELEVLESKRRALQLLSDDEMTVLNERKGTLSAELNAMSGKQGVLKEKENWLTRLATLNEQIGLAEKDLSTARERLVDAQPEIEKLRLIDSVQQIRDDYMSLRDIKQEYSNATLLCSTLEKQLQEHDDAFEKACKAAENALSEQERINGENLNAQPLIAEAGQLEKQCERDTKVYEEQVDGIKSLREELEKNRKIISACKQELESLRREAGEKTEWLDRHAEYSEAIPMIPSIIANIGFIKNEQLSIRTKTENLEKAIELRKAYECQAVTAQENRKALEQTMSSEIALLRKRLVDGEPCPVCGSRIHEVVEIAANILQEKELEKAKEDNRILLESLEKNISGCNIEIETLNTVIEQHNRNIAQYRQANIAYLAGISNAHSLLEEKDAVRVLKELSSNWKNYNERLVVISNEITLCTNRESHHHSRLEDIEKELQDRITKNRHLKDEIGKCKERILQILGKWKSCDDMQQYYNNSVASAGKAYTAATELKTRINIERNGLKGRIAEKKKQLDEAESRINFLVQKVNGYLLTREDGMDFVQLESLLSTGYDTISAMRKRIDTITKSVTAADATLVERRQNLEKHKASTIKPAENEDVVHIKDEMAKLEKDSQEMNAQLIQINAQLLEDKKNRLEFSRYSEEYELKMQQKSHWSTLNEIYGASDGNKLMRLAQGYTLDILLDVANIHLAEMTGRYRLARNDCENMGIMVIDLDMMSESRSAHTLSGGETFIVSLALSLALSSLSSNRMRIESLFIDEGFGALDKNTLQTALMMLEKLHCSGRKIGVISHLTEMLEQIPVKVNVARISPGRSKVEITEEHR